MKPINLHSHSQRRKNILTGEWVLVSPHRTQRPWQGELTGIDNSSRPEYDSSCYLCPGNIRANGERNPRYDKTFVFTNDFSALLPDIPHMSINQDHLLIARSETGICRVVNFSPRHDLTLAEMSVAEIEYVVAAWHDEFKNLAGHPGIKHVQIFENKGAIMGNSNPHPHGQIWAQQHVPMEMQKELKHFAAYYKKHGRTLLADYLRLELQQNERLVWENDSFVIVVPFWAVWPYETLVISKRTLATILDLSGNEKRDFAETLKTITARYDNLFNISFPYSAGIHQAPCDQKVYPEMHFHMHFYPPLLRSATIKKFMVGYEMLAEPQRDVTPESSAETLRNTANIHYRQQI